MCFITTTGIILVLNENTTDKPTEMQFNNSKCKITVLGGYYELRKRNSYSTVPLTLTLNIRQT